MKKPFVAQNAEQAWDNFVSGMRIALQKPKGYLVMPKSKSGFKRLRRNKNPHASVDRMVELAERTGKK